MMKIESRIGRSAYSDRKIYDFITDFRNYERLLPEGQVTEWEASEDRCSFRVEPVGRTGLRIHEKTPCTLVKISSVPELSSYQFTIWIQLKQVAESDTRIRITIEPQVSPMLLPIIRSPLKKFADTLLDQMETFSF